MIEPSKEAKQAAEEWVAPVEMTHFREAFAYGYDAATAKSREETTKLRERLEDWQQCAESNGKDAAKLQEKLGIMKKQHTVLERMLSDKDKEQETQPELAHQQPSAPTAEDREDYLIATEPDEAPTADECLCPDPKHDHWSARCPIHGNDHL